MNLLSHLLVRIMCEVEMVGLIRPIEDRVGAFGERKERWGIEHHLYFLEERGLVVFEEQFLGRDVLGEVVDGGAFLIQQKTLLFFHLTRT